MEVIYHGVDLNKDNINELLLEINNQLHRLENRLHLQQHLQGNK